MLLRLESMHAEFWNEDWPGGAGASPSGAAGRSHPTAMQLIGVRRSTVYALFKAGELRTVKLGRATLITMSSL